QDVEVGAEVLDESVLGEERQPDVQRHLWEEVDQGGDADESSQLALQVGADRERAGEVDGEHALGPVGDEQRGGSQGDEEDPDPGEEVEQFAVAGEERGVLDPDAGRGEVEADEHHRRHGGDGEERPGKDLPAGLPAQTQQTAYAVADHGPTGAGDTQTRSVVAPVPAVVDDVVGHLRSAQDRNSSSREVAPRTIRSSPASARATSSTMAVSVEPSSPVTTNR